MNCRWILTGKTVCIGVSSIGHTVFAIVRELVVVLSSPW